jgi:DNA-binding IclR family transcriptional regulator
MTHQDHIPAQAIPPHARLIQMVTGTWVGGALVAAAKLNVADQLASGPKSAAELAGPMHASAASLNRLMRTLASLGLLASRPDGRYELTALGAALKDRRARLRKSDRALIRQRLVSTHLERTQLFGRNRPDRV